MGRIDDIGEAAVTFLSKAFYHMVGFLIWLIKIGEPLGKKLGENIKVYQYFERRNIELKDYVVLKAQVATAVLAVTAVVFVFELLSFKTLIILFVVFGGYSLYLVLVQLKELFFEEYSAYKVFFLSYLAISVILVILKFVKPTVNFVFPYFHFLLVASVSVVAVSILFKRKYGRNYTFGVVVKEGDIITVRVNYDLLSSTKRGTFLFENRTNAKEGDVVKLLVESSRFNLSGSKIVGPTPDAESSAD